MLIIPDNHIEVPDIIKCEKYVTFDKKGNIRLDRIDIKAEKGRRVLERMSHFGHLFGNLFTIDDFTFSKTDIESNRIESAEMSVTNGVFGTEHVPYPTNYIGIDGEAKNFPFINKAIYDINKLVGYNYRNSELSDNVKLNWIADAFEDKLNIGYSGLIGNLTVIITRASLSIPFRLDIIIDSSYGYNIKNFKEIYKDGEFSDIVKKEINSLNNSLKVISRKLREIKEKEKRQLRIYVGIREFDSFIKIKDIDFNTEYELHLNNSDHARSLFTTISHLGSKWFDTEEFGDLLETKCITVPAAMYEMGDENRRFTYETTDYTDNFQLSYF